MIINIYLYNRTDIISYYEMILNSFYRLFYLRGVFRK